MGRRSTGKAKVSAAVADDLGLPEHSALTVEGRVERAGMAGNYFLRRRRGHERPLHQSQWTFGLWLILLVLFVITAIMVIAFVV